MCKYFVINPIYVCSCDCTLYIHVLCVTAHYLQLERKRHLGNDIVVIIFVDGESPESAYESCLTFNPSCMRSHFNHIFALVTFDQTKNAYRYTHVHVLYIHVQYAHVHVLGIHMYMNACRTVTIM